MRKSTGKGSGITSDRSEDSGRHVEQLGVAITGFLRSLAGQFSALQYQGRAQGMPVARNNAVAMNNAVPPTPKSLQSVSTSPALRHPSRPALLGNECVLQRVLEVLVELGGPTGQND
jgi:hypothetical protein